ncbi:hypothetical protein I5Q82_09260 [Acutalibacter muris]|uniref:Uncharacterized protein n=1 Tax=Acutalibacter muris TaxID=1796620 RepID=A0A1Z2XMU4_9FIRM|nr:hypothetical protein [Acutalibacter muris]ANU53570.1 hypothetical protein A4V00_05720 [Hungateiclostridiaceae bacterium KB18]ANU54256.1 hypothetical protein A4V00_09620 [Hungateiclostridiaceae bacterium KB18]ASB39756.1 hypothetical protein ADH66_03255 [Acutalibacter muris]ASB42523.1 hypothetical protein ADH66_18840 [Acutalibacter muris]QQR29048.1 hypothetical protein I5Q82_13310 [Acutalibacter muris]
MKKILTAIIAAALLVSSAGCQVQQPQAPHSEPEPAPQALILNVASPNDTSEERIYTSAVIEQITAGLKVKLDTADKKKVEPKASPAAQRKEVQESEKQPENPAIESKAATATPTPEPPATEPDAYLKVTVRATPTPPPAATTAPTPTPEPPVPTPAPAGPTPAPAEPTPEPVIEEPTFDIGYWIGYAQSCAQGLGLRLESSAVDCWDNPIGAGPHSTCLERDISSRLNRYANDPDITDVWVWYESTGNNTYNIYIGYA